MIILDFNDLDEQGILFEINEKVLHLLGLSLIKNPRNGFSFGAIIESTNFQWKYNKEITKKYRKYFYQILKNFFLIFFFFYYN